MIISSGRRFIFAHIPKTGGTAFAHAYDARAMKDDVLIGDTPKARQRRGRLTGVKTAGRLWKHSTLGDVDGLISADRLDDWRVVTMVRNPWDRMVSYYHWLRVQTFTHPTVTLARTVDFAGFILHAQTARSIAAHPATRYVTDAAGQMRGTDFIRLEHWREDAEPLWRHLGFALTLPHLNRSDRREDWRAYYTDRTAARVAEFASEDIARFGYGFDPA